MLILSNNGYYITTIKDLKIMCTKESDSDPGCCGIVKNVYYITDSCNHIMSKPFYNERDVKIQLKNLLEMYDNGCKKVYL